MFTMFLQTSTTKKLTLNKPKKCFCAIFCVRRTSNQGQTNSSPGLIRAYVRTRVTTKFSRLDGLTYFYGYECSARGRIRRPQELRYKRALSSENRGTGKKPFTRCFFESGIDRASDTETAETSPHLLGQEK